VEVVRPATPARPDGVAGSVSLYGDRGAIHQLLADHLTAEYRVVTHGRGRSLEEWRQDPGRTENHWWDGFVGNCVAASVCGLQWKVDSAAGCPATVRQQQYRDLAAEFNQAAREATPDKPVFAGPRRF
jgi:hypothetical protein